MVPAYTNIAHFRAPYENAYFAGYGQEPPPPPPPGPPGALTPDEGALAQMVEKKGGIYYWKPDAAASVMNTLPGLRAVFVGGAQELVQLVPYTAEEVAASQQSPEAKKYLEQYSAYNWVRRKLKEGKVVLAPVWITSNVERSMVAIPAGDKEKIQQSASTPLYAILAQPSMLDRFPGGMLGAAVVGTAVVGGLALLVYGKKRRGRAKSPSFRMS